MPLLNKSQKKRREDPKKKRLIWPSPALHTCGTHREEYISKEPPNTWLLFSDDDDLWGPERVRLYGAVVDRHGRQPGVTGVPRESTEAPRRKTPGVTQSLEVVGWVCPECHFHALQLHGTSLSPPRPSM